MSWKTSLLLGLFGLVAVLLIAAAQNSPGYMDADYYYIGGLRLAAGDGLSEDILWNYLDVPSGLPHPSHGYWMPLVSLIVSAGLLLNRAAGYAAGRLGFLVIAALIPPMTAALAMQLYGRRRLALLAGCFAILPMFYLPYMPVTDVFGPLMLLGCLFFMGTVALSLKPGEAQRGGKVGPGSSGFIPFLLGLLAGLMHLARADGAIWIVVALVAVVAARGRPESRRLVWPLLACVLGYFLVMGPWFVRDLAVFGSPLSPGGSRALWIRNYDELFIYPAGQLTFQRWWQAGLAEILRARLWAAGQNLQTALAVQGEIFLAPLILVGMWRMRRDLAIRIAAFAWGLVFLAMTVVFPFQGARGGFFHSGAAFQPLFWALAPLGLETLLEWGSRRRGWRLDQARWVFGVSLVVLALFVTLSVSYKRLFATGANWDAGADRYKRVELYLISIGAAPREVVMVNNSPGYYAAASRPAISIPYAGLQQVCAAAGRYHAGYLLLEIDQIPGEGELFSQPGDKLCLHALDTVDGVRVFEVVGP